TPPQRHDREHEPVEVIVDVEVGRESGAGELRLIPAAVVALGHEEPMDPAADRRRALARSIEGEQRPSGLRSGAGPSPDPRWIIVGAAVLAPPSVGVLVILEPADR